MEKSENFWVAEKISETIEWEREHVSALHEIRHRMIDGIIPTVDTSLIFVFC